VTASSSDDGLGDRDCIARDPLGLGLVTPASRRTPGRRAITRTPTP